MESMQYVSNFAILCQMIVINLGFSEATVQYSIITKANLTGGPRDYEGLVAFQYGNEWLNLCAVNETIISDLEEIVCKSTHKNAKPSWYMSNVFRAKQTPTGMEPTHCHKISSDRINCTAKIYNCSSVVSICCSTSMDLKPNNECSANWTATLGKKLHHLFNKPNISQIRGYQFIDTGNKDIKQSWMWIKYAIEVLGNRRNGTTNVTVDNIEVTDTVRSCANKWLNETLSTTANDDNKQERFTCQEANVTFRLVTEQTNRIVLCIAVKDMNGRPLLEVMDCGIYLPSFVRTNQDKIIAPTPKSNDVQSNDVETKDHSVIIAVTLTLIVVVAVVLSVGFLYRYVFRKKRKRREDSVNNFMNNDTYFRSAREKDDVVEEYALISDVEVSSIVVERYKPPLPKRDGDSEQEVCTIDEYSLPKDSVPEREIDLVYTNTYDDPIRMKLKRNTSSPLENKSRTSSKDLSGNKQSNKTKPDLNESYEEVALVSIDLSDIKKNNETTQDMNTSNEDVACVSKDNLTNKLSGSVDVDNSNTKELLNETPRNSNL